MKKILQIPLILLILAQTTAFAQAIWNGTADAKWYNDSQTEFTITTPEQLAEFSKQVNEGNNFRNKTVKLDANIMLNDTANWQNWASKPPANEWTPIGNWNGTWNFGFSGTFKFGFSGTFDGNGFIVSGVYSYNGLFGIIDSSGTVKNLGITASYINGEKDIGGLTGYSNGTISNSYFTGIVKGIQHIGGLVGLNNIGMVNNSYSAGTVMGNFGVGGLVGSNIGTINGSYSISAVMGKSYDVGGLVGHHHIYLITNSFSAGSVNGSKKVGGLVGYINYGEVSNSYSASAVKGNSLVGGLVGSSIYGLVSNSYSTGKVVGNSGAGGLIGNNIRGNGWNGDIPFDGAVSSGYYDKQSSGQSRSDGGVGKATSVMQSKEFVDSLNFVAGVLSMNSWSYSEGKYPVLSTQTAKIDIGSFFASGEGTEANPYIINTKEQLKNFSFLAKNGAVFLNKHFKLGGNIMLNDTANWQNWAKKSPAYIWIAPKNFRGIFDGNGFVISGVYVNNFNDHQGLFGFLNSNVTIKNLGITASYIKGRDCVGGLAGKGEGAVISNSYFVGEVIGQNSVGGLVGYTNKDSIINSYSMGKVAGKKYVGGFAGENYSRIINSYFSGKVTGIKNVGGLTGKWYYYTKSSYYNKQTNGQKDGDGIGKTTTEMKQKSTYEGWDFGKVWGISGEVNGGYPYLRK
jgi:hypothetical protein